MKDKSVLFIREFISLLIATIVPICGFAQLPIKLARHVSFTTSEGSNMNVDISPDGKILVFDLLGDLYKIPVNGGNAVQLTKGLALHIAPVWSPDGRMIAFNSDLLGAFHLTLMDLATRSEKSLDPSGLPLDKGFNAHWSPDSKTVSNADTVYKLDSQKTQQKLPIKQPVRFSEDGNVIYGVESAKLWRYDRVSESKTALTDVPEFTNSYCLSPDARWFCYILDDSTEKKVLMAQNLVTGVSKVLVPSLIEKTHYFTRDMPVKRFSISPDSKFLYIAYTGKIHRITLETGQDHIIPFSAVVHVDMGKYNYHTFSVSHAPFSVKYMRHIQASPDGKQLVFEALNRIYLLDLPKGKPRLLADQPYNQFQPAFSPDGKWITYVTWCDTSGGALWRAPVKRGTPVRLAHDSGQYQHPVWSPDGTHIAYVHSKLNNLWYNDQGQGQLKEITLTDGREVMQDDSVPLWNEVRYSPDGKSLIYTPAFRGKYKSPVAANLMEKDAAGNLKKVLAIGTSITADAQKMISPDGRYLVYSVAEDLYLIPVNPSVAPTFSFNGVKSPGAIRFAAGVDPVWEKGGKVLSWTYGNRFYRIDPGKVVKAATQQHRPVDNFKDVIVRPDQQFVIHLTVPSKYAHPSVALTNVRILTMNKTQVIKNGIIVIRDGRITAVGDAKAITVPPGSKVINLAGKTIMPGFVDTHLHLHLSSDILPQQFWTMLSALAYGITTARDPASNLDAFGFAERVRTGQMIGPRLFTVGHPVRQWDGVIRMDDQADADKVVQKRKLFGSVVIKQYDLEDRIRRQRLLLASEKYGLNMTNEGNWNPALELAMVKDGSTGVEHSPVLDDVSGDYVQFYAKSHVFFTPTLQVSYSVEVKNKARIGQDNYGGLAYFDRLYWHRLDSKFTRFKPDFMVKYYEGIVADTLTPNFLPNARFAAQVVHAGGNVCMGSHGNDEGFGAHNELWALQMGGLTNMEALQAATIMGARAIGIQKDVGSIEVGKIADLIVLNSNPLDDIHNSRDIKYVMKDGVLYDGDTLDEIWPVKKKCPEWKLKTSAVK